MRGKKLLGFAAAASVMLIGSAAPALALTDPNPGANPVPSTNLVDGQTIQVSWTSATSGQLMFISECWRPQSDPNFVDANTSCSSLSINPNSNASGAGTVPFNVFVGADPDIGQNACAFNQAQAGSATLHTTCWIRVAAGTIDASGANVLSLPITFADPNGGGGGGVPEAPLAILLPLGAATVVAGGYFYSRRRRAAA